MSFVFYDTETTGTHTAFDQILQFAAIRTDDNLNEIERVDMRCRLLPHVIPSAAAMRVTRVGIEQLLDPALPSHYEMVGEIANKLRSWSPAIFAGWNTMRFDESMLRQALYQNLHPPYLTSAAGNGRTDVMVLAQALSALAPDTLELPLGDNGKTTFKLDRLAPANGFAHANAHEALADVEATIHICRLIRDRAPDVWRNAVAHSRKADVLAFVKREPAFMQTASFFNRPYQFALAQIGSEQGNPGTIFAFDLRADFDGLRALTDEQLGRRLAGSPKVLRTIRANAAPVLSRLNEAAGFAGITTNELRSRAARLRSDSDLCARLTRLASMRAERELPAHLEEQIYSAFSDRADERVMQAFHEAPWNYRMSLIERFRDKRLAGLGQRLMFLNAPGLLTDEIEKEQRAWLTHRIFGRMGASTPWRTVTDALSEAEAMLGDPVTATDRIVSNFCRYLKAQSTTTLLAS